MSKAIYYINSFRLLRSLAKYNTNSIGGLKLFFVPLLNFSLANLFIRLKAIISKKGDLLEEMIKLPPMGTMGLVGNVLFNSPAINVLCILFGSFLLGSFNKPLGVFLPTHLY